MEKVLMHTCCAPCSLSCIDPLREEGIEPVAFWYNPNIHPWTEHDARRGSRLAPAPPLGVSCPPERGPPLASLYEPLPGQPRQPLTQESNRLENAGLLLSTRTVQLLHTGMARLDSLRSRLRIAATERLINELRRCASFGTQVSQCTAQRLTAGEARMHYARERLAAAAEGVIERTRSRLELLQVSIDAASPRRILSRGYAIVRGVRSVTEVHTGQSLRIELQDGTLHANVTSKIPSHPNG